MSYESALRTHYAEIHSRLCGKPPKPPAKIPPIHKRKYNHRNKLSGLSPQSPQSKPLLLPPSHLNLASLFKWVAESEGLTVQEMRSEQRLKHIGRSRFIFYHLARLVGHYALNRIGLQSNKDHSTVAHGILRLAELRLRNSDLDARVSHYERLLETANHAAAHPEVMTCQNCPFRPFQQP